MPITLAFKSGTVRTFFEATRASRTGDLIALMSADGSELCRFDADHIATVDRLPLDEVAEHGWLRSSDAPVPQDETELVSTGSLA